MNDDETNGNSRQIPLRPAGERTLTIHEIPLGNEARKEIHERRPLPVVPDAESEGEDNG
jgi:hypothetical protein